MTTHVANLLASDNRICWASLCKDLTCESTQESRSTLMVLRRAEREMNVFSALIIIDCLTVCSAGGDDGQASEG